MTPSVYLPFVSSGPKPGGRALGPDVSFWQDEPSTPQQINFDVMKAAGAEFVMIKASQALWMDSDILYNWVNAKRAGLLRGAYHFFVWDKSPEAQAEFFWGVLERDPGEIPPALDYEWWGTTPQNAEELIYRAAMRLKALCGRRPGIYTSAAFWREGNASADLARECWLWVANYREYGEPTLPADWRTWKLWQWTSHGDGGRYGVESGNIDLNWFNGTAAELREFCGLTNDEVPPPPPLPPPPPTTWKVRVTASIGLRIRGGAGANYPRMGVLSYGAIVEIASEVPGWLKLADGRGWISEIYTGPV